MTVTDLVAVKATVRVDAYRIIADAVERGIMWGWQHSHKHTDDPDRYAIEDAIFNDIMNELCGVLRFDDEW